MTERPHPEPTPATVKALYGRAFRCAKPDCRRPLYTIDPETGDRTLNSRIAHIHARRPGGPRWEVMPSEENRSYENLLLLCIEHSYAIDEHEARFPPELLRTWKTAQENEYEQLQQNWPLTDAEAGRVLQASSARQQQHAESVVGVVRAAEHLALEATSLRSRPAVHAAAWQRLRRETRSQFLAWDSDGNRVYAEPPRIRTDQHRAAIIAALEDVSAVVTPLAHAVKVELAASSASNPAVERWCQWVSDRVDKVVAASSTWPETVDLQDDSQLTDAVAHLRGAVGQLAAAWRGEAADEPPSVIEPVLEPDSGPDALTVYRELLARAQPFARVDHREYDADLRAALVAAAPAAATIPMTLTTWAMSLVQLCHLAAAVAGNASDDELAALLTSDSEVRPLSAALLLLDESRQAAEKRSRPEVAERARSEFVALWENVDWSTPESWNGNDTYAGPMFAAAARLISVKSVLARLDAALAANPELVLTMVTSCAGWGENVDSRTWQHRAFVRSYQELPPWFPTEAVQSAAATFAAHVSASEKDSLDADPDPERLLAHVLYLAKHAGRDDADDHDHDSGVADG